VAFLRKRQTLNERLLAQGPRSASNGSATAEPVTKAQPTPLSARVAVWVVFIVLGQIVTALHVTWWVAVPVLALPWAWRQWVFLRGERFRTQKGRVVARLTARLKDAVRRILVLVFALSIALAVLVAVGGFQHDDLVLLAAVFAVVAAVWVVDRAVAHAASRTAL
jgi:hypothetical protein